MSFLDDFNIAVPPPASGGLSFLDEDNHGGQQGGSAVPSFLTPETTPRRPGTSGAFMNILSENNDNTTFINNGQQSNEQANRQQSMAKAFENDLHNGCNASMTSMTAVVSSAEELHFPRTSLRNKKWDLYRHKILGKGSFGCATLYSRSPLSPPAAVPLMSKGGSSVVVVKDVNIQTMTCKEEEMAALRDEVTALEKAAGHPNMVQLLDYHHDEAGMMAYIITEFCEGGDVAVCLEKAKQGEYFPPAPTRKCSYSGSKIRYFPEEVVASVLIQVVVGLHHLHVVSRILHRDLKPHNLFLLSDRITVRLGDFGVAALLQSVGEKAKAMCGSPFYMAPELCAEKPYDGEADIWSLGVLLYEMMALVRPFNAASAPALSQLVMKGKCVPLWERTTLTGTGSPNSSLSGGGGKGLPYSRELMDLVMSMLTVDPSARPTLRRLLRSTYVRRHLYTVPKTVLKSEVHYGKLFDPAEWKAALEKCLYEGAEDGMTTEVSEGEEDSYEDDFEDEEE